MSLLQDICTVEYPMPDNKNRAILSATEYKAKIGLPVLLQKYYCIYSLFNSGDHILESFLILSRESTLEIDSLSILSRLQ